MTNTEAYGAMTYDQRAQQSFVPGERVWVGPAFTMDHGYQPDPYGGEYEIDSFEGATHYKLRKPGHASACVVMNVTRIVPYWLRVC